MTVPSATSKSGPYLCNGSTDVFNYDFRIVDKSHLNVILTDADGAETSLALTTHYTVSDVGEDTGSINLTSAGVALAVTGKKLTILRNPPFTQETDLQNQGAYYAETVEKALDLAVMRDQEIAEKVSRALIVGYDQSGQIVPAPQDDRVLGWLNGRLVNRTVTELPQTALAGANGLDLLAAETRDDALDALAPGATGREMFDAADASTAREILDLPAEISATAAGLLAAIDGPDIEALAGQAPRRPTPFLAAGNYVINSEDYAPGAAHLVSVASGTVRLDIATLHVSRSYVIDVIGAAAVLELDCGSELVIQGAMYSPSAANNTTLIVPSDHTVTIRKFAGGKIIAAIDAINGFWRSVAVNNWARRMSDGTYEYLIIYPNNINATTPTSATSVNSAYDVSDARVVSVTLQPQSNGAALPNYPVQVTKLGTTHSLNANQFVLYNPNSGATASPVVVLLSNVKGP